MPSEGLIRTGDRTWLIALAASLWGFSAVLREPLAQDLPALTIVVAEHVVLVIVLLPWLVPSVRAFLGCTPRTQLGVLVIGAGSSALATTMFTAAFRLGDPITPQVLQKLQPVLAILLAALILGERVTRRFPLFAVPAIVGAWLLAFPEPFGVQVQGAQAAALAVGAALLWAAGTVLGRMVSAELAFLHVTTLRFAFGFLTLVVLVALTETSVTMPAEFVPRLVALALIPGLLALVLYYFGLRQTPAMRATLAELAFPLTAAAVGVTMLDGHLDGSQWLGFGVVLVSVVVLALHEHAARSPVVAVPNDAAVAVSVSGRSSAG